MSKTFSHLNTNQLKAVKATEGRVLILAGAGSGKTSVLANRIAYIIQSSLAAADEILGLTFTNKAAKEMRERVGNILDRKTAKKITLCTFHSFCMQVLRRDIHWLGYTSQFSLYDENDVKRLLKQLARQILEHEGELPSLESTLSKIAYAKSRGGCLDETNQENANWHDQFSKQLFNGLHISMRAYNAVDFDSLLSLTTKLFEEFPNVLEHYQNRFKYIMIDEYQDTNPVQYRLASLLSAKHNNLCVVGDDDQSIYGWRGAEIKNILQFESKTIIKLEQNYRSTPTILNAANAVIKNNQERHEKQLWTASDQGDPIIIFHAPTEVEETQSVVQRLIWFRKHKNLQWKNMAILYRSNVLARPFELALLQAVWEKDGNWVRGIPYQVFGGTEFYERSEIKDLMAYLKAICNPLDQEALLRIINVPRRGISDNALDILTAANRSQKIALWDLLQKLTLNPLEFLEIREKLSDRALKGISNFMEIVNEAKQKFETKPLNEALKWLLEKIDYKKAILEDVKSDKMRDFKWENVNHCVEALANYEKEMEAEGTSAEISLSHFLANTLLDQEKFTQKEKDFKEDKVNLMTFHSAKGLEFDACFLVGLEDHIIPHEKSVAERGLEEERRLMYVAMTRAKKHLTLSMARNRKRMGKEMNSNPSRFLFEIPQQLLKMTPWQTLD